MSQIKLRKAIISEANDSFYDTLIKNKYLDVYTAGFYAAIIAISESLEKGKITKKQLKDLAKDLDDNWPTLQKPKKEKEWAMVKRCSLKERQP